MHNQSISHHLIRSCPKSAASMFRATSTKAVATPLRGTFAPCALPRRTSHKPLLGVVARSSRYSTTPNPTPRSASNPVRSHIPPRRPSSPCSRLQQPRHARRSVVTQTMPGRSETMPSTPPSAGNTSNPQPGRDAELAGPTFESLGIRHTEINVAPDVGSALKDRHRVIVGSVLDLFSGRPTYKLLTTLWSRDAVFRDPLCTARGYDQFAAQWYGLPALFDPIEIQDHRVVAAPAPHSETATPAPHHHGGKGDTGGFRSARAVPAADQGGRGQQNENRIEVELVNKYTVKGIGKEQVIRSKVVIQLDHAGSKIDALEDRWDGELGGAAVVEAFRKLNAVTVPKLVRVPQSEEEDRQMREEAAAAGTKR